MPRFLCRTTASRAKGYCMLRCRRENCIVLIAASILAARKLSQYDGGTRVPATMSAIADAIRWAEQIMAEIDRRGPVKDSKNSGQKAWR